MLVLSGFGIKLRCIAGQIAIEDGVGLKRRTIHLPRITRNLRRIIVIGSDGFCTFEALRSLAEIGVSVTFLDRIGRILFATSPTAPSDPRLRRAQSSALMNGSALKISKELIAQKITNQAALVRELFRNDGTADTIANFRAELSSTQSIESVRIIESQAARHYWSAWAGVPVRWPQKDEKRVAEHWRLFGSRISPLTHSPRLAANPPNAILNLLYSLLGVLVFCMWTRHLATVWLATSWNLSDLA